MQNQWDIWKTYKKIFYLALLVLSLVCLIAGTPIAASKGSESGRTIHKKFVRILYPQPPSKNDPRAEYYLKLLKTALDKTTPTHGGYAIAFKRHNNPAKRTHESLRYGELDITVAMTTVENEKNMRPVRIPLTKGLIGYRIFLINDKEQLTFDKIKNEKQLKKMLASQPHYWPDYDILKANGFRVSGMMDYEANFKAVSSGRVDYFPRSVLEIFAELKNTPHSNLAVENKILLVYPAAIYFFVALENQALEARIHRGLMMAQEDGTFNKLLSDYLKEDNVIERIDIAHRNAYFAENPYLPSDTPLGNPALWLRPEDLQYLTGIQR